MNSTQRKSRPEKGESRATDRPGEGDPRYAAMGTHRDILGVLGRDADWTYRWVLDVSETGQHIFDVTQDGWDLVDATKETLQIGERAIEKTDQFGSIVRKPADKTGQFLYLMRIPNWVYEQRQDLKMERVDELEADMFRERDSDTNEDGQYGKNRIKHEVVTPRQPGFDD